MAAVTGIAELTFTVEPGALPALADRLRAAAVERDGGSVAASRG